MRQEQKMWVITGNMVNFTIALYNIIILLSWMDKLGAMGSNWDDGDEPKLPINMWDGQKTWTKTNGYKQLFERNWYFQATTAEGKGSAELQDFMVECYGWLPGKIGQTGHVGFNHTI